MTLDRLTSTTQRVAILNAVVFATKPLSVSALAQQLKVSKGLVSRYLDWLVHEGLGRKVHGKFLVTAAAPLVKGLKILLTIGRLKTGVFKKYPFVQSVGLYGSCAKGENTADSDLDLWVRVTPAREADLARLTSELRRTIGAVSVLILADAKLKQLKQHDPLFYHALSFGSILLYGAPNALEL